MKILLVLCFCCSVFMAQAQTPRGYMDGKNQFGIRLYKEIIKNQPNQNVFLSPYSVSNALFMTYNGAEGETMEQLRLALNISDDKLSVNESVKRINQKILGVDFQSEILFANGLWMQKDYNFLPAFISDMATFYNAECHQLSFTTEKEKEKSSSEINKWVENRTKGNVKELIKSDQISTNTRLILTNLIWFKGVWQKAFDLKLTHKDVFTNIDGTESTVDFMQQKGYFQMYEDDELSLIELPYTGNNYSMYIILPNKSHDLAAIETNISMHKLQGLFTSTKQSTIQVTIPKLNESSNLELKPILQALGIELAFSESADFSSITGSKDLFIDKIYHKSNFELNEEGSKAAAASAVVMSRKSAAIQEVKFIANKPFIYLIRENSYGSILFVGRKATFN